MSIFDRWFKRPTAQEVAQEIIGMTAVKVAEVVPTWREGKPLEPATNFNQLVKDGWRRNELIFACSSRKANTTSQVALKVHNKSTGTELPDHPLRVLLSKPNKRMSEFDFLSSISVFQDFAGISYYEKIRSSAGKVVELYPMRPDWVRPIPSSVNFISGYEYGPPGGNRDLLPAENVLYFPLFDPIDMYKGWPPVAVAARVGDLDNSITDYIRLMFQEGGVPPGLLKTKQAIDESIADGMRARWKSRYGGYGNWLEPAVLGYDLEYQQVGLGLEAMGLEILDKRSETRICLTPGTQIVTQRGLVAIEKMQVGDMVLTHLGRWRAVKDVMANPSHDKVYEIKAQGLDALRATGNHPVYAAQYEQSRSHFADCVGLDWIAARDLRPKKTRGGWDSLTIPVLSECESRALKLRDWIHGRRFSVSVENDMLVHSHPNVKTIPASVPMSAALGRLLGYYLAEGSQGDGKLLFYFNSNEKDYQRQVVDDLYEVFGVVSTMKAVETPNVTAVICQNSMLTELFDCGTATTKIVPAWAWTGDKVFFESMLQTWLNGDGFEKDGKVRGATASLDLAWQMRLIAIYCGHNASIIQWTQRPSTIAGRIIKSGNAMYIVQWKVNAERRIYRLDRGHETTTIRSVDEIDYDGPVYNLEVEDDHSYLTTGGMVHNCMVMKVPPTVISTLVGLERAILSNAVEFQKDWWINDLIPWYKSLNDNFNNQLVPDFGADIEVKWDFNEVPALVDLHKNQKTYALDAFSRGAITRNQYLELVGLPDLGPRGEVYVMSASMVEVPANKILVKPTPVIVAPSKPAAEEDEEVEDQTAEEDGTPKPKKTKAINASDVAVPAPDNEQRLTMERKITKVMTKFFEGELERIIKKVA